MIRQDVVMGIAAALVFKFTVCFLGTQKMLSLFPNDAQEFLWFLPGTLPQAHCLPISTCQHWAQMTLLPLNHIKPPRRQHRQESFLLYRALWPSGDTLQICIIKNILISSCMPHRKP